MYADSQIYIKALLQPQIEDSYSSNSQQYKASLQYYSYSYNHISQKFTKNSQQVLLDIMPKLAGKNVGSIGFGLMSTSWTLLPLLSKQH